MVPDYRIYKKRKMAPKKKGVAKSSNAGQHDTKTTLKLTLRSHKSSSSEVKLSQEKVAGRKRKLISDTGEPPSKIVRKSKGTKCKSETQSHRRSKRVATRKSHAKAMSRTGKESGSDSTISTIQKKNSKSKQKSKPISRKYNPGKINRNLQKSSNKKMTCDNTASKKKTFKRKRKDTFAKHDKIVPYLPHRPVIRIMRVIKTDLKDLISTICRVNERTMWIGRQAYDRLMKVEIEENGRLTILKQFPQIDFYDFCFDKENNRILYCDRKNNCIMSMSSNFEIQQWKTVRPLCPTCITISPEGWIFVRLVHAYAYATPKPDSRQIMDRLGTILQRINSVQNDGTFYKRMESIHKKPSSFMFPHRCSVNPVNNDLVVVGYIEQVKACVCSFNTDGLIKFTYFGIGSPRGVTCSPQGNILVSNEINGDIHILNKNGRCLYVMNMICSGLPEKPWSLSWDLTGHLLIGTMSGKTGSIIISEYTDLYDEDKNALV